MRCFFIVKFEETFQKAKDIFDVAVKKTGDFVSVSKQKISVSGLENKLNRAYAELGKLQYGTLKDAEIEDTDLASAVGEIKRLTQEIKDLTDEIDEAEGKVTCSKCGEKSPADSAFCNKCGESLGKSKD